MRNYNFIGSMTPHEIRIIEENWQTKPDREIGLMIGRPSMSIKNYRVKHGLLKPKGFRAYGFTMEKKQREKADAQYQSNALMQSFLSGKSIR